MTRYTAVTFAPVQGFIEKSRKLRDLYGSSFILSFLAKTICNYAEQEGLNVIVPALINTTRGTPNVIYLNGYIDEQSLRKAFNRAWKALVNTCREYIEQEYRVYLGESNNLPISWKREWDLSIHYGWELFVVCGEEDQSFDDVRARMNDRKQSRDWIGINWRGESSSITGADAIAYPNMADYNPRKDSNPDLEIEQFYTFLSQHFIESSIDFKERLSIPELVKRLITYAPVQQFFDTKFNQPQKHPYFAQIERLKIFEEVNRWEDSRWTGWFQGDGDRLGKYISSLVSGEQSPTIRDPILHQFSGDMLQWGAALQSGTELVLKTACAQNQWQSIEGRIVYAGGDDFFGILYRNSEDGAELTPRECIEGFWYQFNDLWNQCGHDISVSTGFVWAAPNVPQRDLLQHLRTTEKLAKTEGRDRLAIRILFNSGNYLDWSCPWRFLEPLFTSYRDRDGKNQNWTHFYTDIATLESRHAFSNDDSSTAQGIFDIYFPHFERNDVEDWWNQTLSDTTYQRLLGGLLGNKPDRVQEQHQRRNQWIINLAKVGFHLFS